MAVQDARGACTSRGLGDRRSGARRADGLPQAARGACARLAARTLESGGGGARACLVDATDAAPVDRPALHTPEHLGRLAACGLAGCRCHSRRSHRLPEAVPAPRRGFAAGPGQRGRGRARRRLERGRQRCVDGCAPREDRRARQRSARLCSRSRHRALVRTGRQLSAGRPAGSGAGRLSGAGRGACPKKPRSSAADAGRSTCDRSPPGSWPLLRRRGCKEPECGKAWCDKPGCEEPARGKRPRRAPRRRRAAGQPASGCNARGHAAAAAHAAASPTRHAAGCSNSSDSGGPGCDARSSPGGTADRGAAAPGTAARTAGRRSDPAAEPGATVDADAAGALERGNRSGDDTSTFVRARGRGGQPVGTALESERVARRRRRS
ncbi:MAG: hypothetical protein QOJ43_231 [Gaiellaceae bacterium]|nr:hypothetical protein [Gaiellaceae bacterium]